MLCDKCIRQALRVKMQINLTRDINTHERSRFKHKSRLETSGFMHDTQLNTNTNRERLLKQNHSDLSFKGLSTKETSSVAHSINELIENFNNIIGSEAGNNIKGKLKNLESQNPWCNISGDAISFKEETLGARVYLSIIDPLINMPVDLLGSGLGKLQKTKFLKDSKLISGVLDSKLFRTRKQNLDNLSNAMAIKNYAEMLEKHKKDIEKIKNEVRPPEGETKTKEERIKDIENVFVEKIFKGAHKRFDPKIGNYSTNTERAVTRIVTGIAPAFFLANDAYNLSMYVNHDDKKLAKREKQRRFRQEAVRIGITGASTFAILSLLNKKASVASTTFWMVATALTSEIVGRAMTGMPFYPVSKKSAKKFSELEHKNKVKKQTNNTKNKADSVDKQNVAATQTAQSKHKKSDFALKFLGAIVVTGFAIDKLPKYFPAIKRFMEKRKNSYDSMFKKEFAVETKELEQIFTQLRTNGFNDLAKKYEEVVSSVIKKGNLGTKEKFLMSEKRTDIALKNLPEKFKGPIVNTETKDYAKELKTAKDALKDSEIKEALGIQNNTDTKTINLCTIKNKTKDTIINQFILFPQKLISSIIDVPYSNFVKPIIDLAANTIRTIVETSKAIREQKEWKFSDIIKKYKEVVEKNSSKKDKSLSDEENFMNLIEHIRKTNKEEGITPEDAVKANDKFKEKMNKKILDSFDNVTKSTINNAELSGPLKTAVSTATSVFLILDNYNRVMIDSNGENQSLANQKTKERTVQRVIRIAYGATIINIFNSMFFKMYHGSLFGAQFVNFLQTLCTETLERTSVGLPIGESDRETIIEKDNNNLKATGLKGSYFRFMSKLTGKKPISAKADKSKG